MRIAITGHRPDRLKGRKKEIQEWIRQQLELYQGDDNNELYVGMAKGVDIIGAVEGINNGKYGIICCYPFPKKDYSFIEKDIMNKAKKINFTTTHYDEIGKSCYFMRNKFMVDNCDILLAVWDGIEKGGTWNTIKYANSIGRKMIIFHLNERKEN